MRPVKPYPTFPLTPHSRGGWIKKYKQRVLYIPQPDPDEALAEFHRRARAIDAGVDPIQRRPANAATVGQVAVMYSRERRLDHEAGHISRGTLDDYRHICTDMAHALGRDTLVADLTPDLFAAMSRSWSKRLGPHALSRHIQGVRSAFALASDRGWIPAMPKFGSGFRKRKPPRKSGTPLSTNDLRAILAVSDGAMRTFVLLCANAGYTARDCCLLPAASVAPVLVFPRPKMHKRHPIDRACVLWPETLEALKAMKGEGERVFRGERGAEFRSDVACHNFKRLCKTAKVKPRGPAWIRHWFATVADATRDTSAIARIMGHRLPGMREVYVDAVEHDRIAHVSEFVRKALIRPEPPEAGQDYEI
jgi:integrase